MNEHPIESLMKTTMETIKDMVDVNTIVGDAVETIDGTTIIPISRVSFGFASGGGDFENTKKSNNKEDQNGETGKEQLPFAGGAGAGISIQPVAFMVVGSGQMKLMSVDHNANLVDTIIGSAPKVIDSLQSALSKNNKGNKGNKSNEENKTISFE
ncbi:MAG: GerW family sporulation protein [Natronincolaceae bacterium]|jgi:sporulation protein YtfJ|nr:GerW family sporulation protein [Bacillota bacterium]NLK90834.1 sporulation protein YtfJ [Clostridiales bacterium]